MRKLLIPALAASILVFATVLPGLADTNLTDIRPHRHWIVTPAGQWVQVGPRVCDDPSLQAAFNQFHYNVHHTVPGLPTQGPEESAPGLHNGYGADLEGRLCHVVPPAP